MRRAIGKELCANPIVRKVTFTGSTEVGRILMRQSADTIKKLSLELGGNAPFIVFDDADLDAAADGAIASKYRNAGQTCVCANRIYVQDGVYDAFAAKLAEKMKTLKVGKRHRGGREPRARSSTRRASRRSRSTSPTRVAQGREGGRRRQALMRWAGASTSRRSSPGVTPRDEGRRARRPSAPWRRSSASRTRPRRIAHRQRHRVRARRVLLLARRGPRLPRRRGASSPASSASTSGIIANEVAPFGGVKQSGLGREGSKYGIEDFLEIKYVCLGGIQ